MSAGATLQSGAKGAAESFNKFVESQDEHAGNPAGNKRNAEPERKDFWDNFGAPVAGAQHDKSSTIGTSAVKKGDSGGVGDKDKGREEGWGDEW